MCRWRSEHPSFPNVQASSGGPDTRVWFPVPAVWPSVYSEKAFDLQLSRSQVLWAEAGSLYEVKCRMGGVWDPNHPSQPVLCTKAWGSALISPSGLFWPLGGLGHQPLQLFPPTHSALSRSQALPGGAFSSPAKRPLGLRVRAHPFPVPPQLRPQSGWKVSLLKTGGSSSFLPGGPGKPKASGEGCWAPGPPTKEGK